MIENLSINKFLPHCLIIDYLNHYIHGAQNYVGCFNKSKNVQLYRQEKYLQFYHKRIFQLYKNIVIHIISLHAGPVHFPLF